MSESGIPGSHGRGGGAEEPQTGARRMVLNMGPQHPSTHGVLRLLLELDGETIVKCQPDIGYLHTGIEKEFEVKTYQQAVTLTDRVDYLAPLSNNLGYCLAVEKLLGLEIPPQAQWMRVMLTELTRLNSHLVWLGTHAIDIGAMTRVPLLLPRARRHSAHLRNVLRPAHDDQLFPHRRAGAGAAARLAAAGQEVHRRLSQPRGRVRRPADQQPHLDRAARKGVGVISLEDMLDLGVTGPMLRAAGLKIDARKDEPYTSYEKFDFEVPTRTENDVYARYQVRIEEMRQSARIVRQALEGMPAGAVEGRRAARGAARPRKDEDPDGGAHLSLQDRDRGLPRAGGRSLPGDRIAARRAGLLRGERRHREALTACTCGRPASAICRRTPKMVEGTLIADVIASIGSMDFVLGDTDR